MSRPKDELIDELIREFRTSGNQDDAFDALAAQRLGVSESDLRCLNIVENAGGISAGELAIEAGLTAGAVTGVIDRLERAGYARRIPDPADRRRVTVEVTPAFYKQPIASGGRWRRIGSRCSRGDSRSRSSSGSPRSSARRTSSGAGIWTGSARRRSQAAALERDPGGYFQAECSASRSSTWYSSAVRAFATRNTFRHRSWRRGSPCTGGSRPRWTSTFAFRPTGAWM